jgi:hypothetical protein
MTKEAVKKPVWPTGQLQVLAVSVSQEPQFMLLRVSLVVPVCTLIRSTGFQSSTYDIVHNCVFSTTISVFFSDSISFPPVNNVVLEKH